MNRFLRNVWYVAGWGYELVAGKALGRTLADIPVALYRETNGEVHALLDRCPHRFAPLSLGQVEGASLRCGYHGLRFGADGRCQENPHGPLSAVLTVRGFPVIERHRLLWVWLGELDQADPAEIPSLHFLDQTPAVAFISGYVPTHADHLLMVDNILDLTHADYLHPDSLGGGSITRSKAHIERVAPQCLKVRWDALNEPPLPIMRMNFPEPDALIDMWTEVTWWPNGLMVLSVGGFRTGGNRAHAMEVKAVHIMTPERAGKTHYFYSNSRNFATDDAEVTNAFAKALRFAFEQQDKPMIEAQQRVIGEVDLMTLKPALQPSDAASTQARRIFSERLRAEQSAAAVMR